MQCSGLLPTNNCAADHKLPLLPGCCNNNANNHRGDQNTKDPHPCVELCMQIASMTMIWSLSMAFRNPPIIWRQGRDYVWQITEFFSRLWSKWLKCPEHTKLLVAHCDVMGLTMTTGRSWQGPVPAVNTETDKISELNTNTTLVAVSSVPDQIGILAVTIKIISNFKCANKNIYCLQWPSGYWALRPLWLHNLNNKSYLRWFFTSHAWSDNTVKWPRAEFC